MRARTGALLLVVPLLLAGCAGDDGSGAPADDPADPTAAADAAPAWNPCGGIELAAVERALGGRLTMDRGTEESPRCALLPRREGGAVIDANYLVFPEGLDAAWEQMGAPDDGTVTEPDIPGADDARLVANAGSEALGVTGFVQNGAVVQVVNAVDTAPYDRAAVVAAVEETMRQLSSYAREGGAPQ